MTRTPGESSAVRGAHGVDYRDASGTQITDVWNASAHRYAQYPARLEGRSGTPPDPLGHIQATGVDSRGRTQYRYHPVWREQREAQKFTQMSRFARA